MDSVTGSGYDGFRDGDDVTVPDLKAFIFRSFQNAVRYDFGQIIPFPDNRAADASGYGTDTAFSLFIRHMSSLLLYYAYLTSGRWPGQLDFIIADEGQCIHSFFIPSARPVPFSAKKYSPRQTCLTIKRRHYYSNDVRQEKKFSAAVLYELPRRVRFFLKYNIKIRSFRIHISSFSQKLP